MVKPARVADERLLGRGKVTEPEVEDGLARLAGRRADEFAWDHGGVPAVPEADIELAASGPRLDGDGESTEGDIDEAAGLARSTEHGADFGLEVGLETAVLAKVEGTPVRRDAEGGDIGLGGHERTNGEGARTRDAEDEHVGEVRVPGRGGSVNAGRDRVFAGDDNGGSPLLRWGGAPDDGERGAGRDDGGHVLRVSASETQT